MYKRMKLTVLLAVTILVVGVAGTALADEVVPFSNTDAGTYVNLVCTEPVTVEFELTFFGTDHFASDGSLTVHLHADGRFMASTAEGETFRDNFRTNSTLEFDPDGTLVEWISRGVRFHWSMPTLGHVAQQAGRIDDISIEILTGPVSIDPQLEADFRAYSGFTGDLLDVLFIQPNPDLNALFINYGYCWVLGVAP